MLNISASIKVRLEELSERLQADYLAADHLGRADLRALLRAHVGEIRSMRRLGDEELERLRQAGGVAAVDGSVNYVGAGFPHYVAMLQAVARSSAGGESVRCGDAHTPLLDEELVGHRGPDLVEGAFLDARKRSARLAALELEAAAGALERFRPRVFLFDGSLVRFRIEAGHAWEEFRRQARAGGVLVAGVIEEVGTRLVAERLARAGCPARGYDRDLLFGVLDHGEMLDVGGPEAKKGRRTCLLRSSLDPQVVGMDVPEEQEEDPIELASLVFTLTPRSGRGIPLWLDIVDSEARITDEMAEALVAACVDPLVVKRLFGSKRRGRPY